MTMPFDSPSREPQSGTWCGWWRQGLREGHEALRLTITGQRIHGSGQDQDGSFALDGQVQPNGSASLTKRYTQALFATCEHRAYQGQWNGRVIRGTWVDETSAHSHGPFLLWPSRD
jgi:hypothetical protein